MSLKSGFLSQHVNPYPVKRGDAQRGVFVQVSVYQWFMLACLLLLCTRQKIVIPYVPYFVLRDTFWSCTETTSMGSIFYSRSVSVYALSIRVGNLME